MIAQGAYTLEEERTKERPLQAEARTGTGIFDKGEKIDSPMLQRSHSRTHSNELVDKMKRNDDTSRLGSNPMTHWKSIGILTIEILQGRQLNNIVGTLKPYTKVQMLCQSAHPDPSNNNPCWVIIGEQCTPVQEGLNVRFDTVVEFPVFDLNTDLQFEVFDKIIGGLLDQCHGQVIIPLSLLLGKMGRVLPPQCQWYELFPTTSDTKKYTSAVDDMPGVGMHKPQHTLGFLEIKLDLRMHEPLFLCYLLPPPRPDPRWLNVIPIYPEDIDPSTFKGNFGRMNRLSNNPPYWIMQALFILTWESPSLSWSVVGFWAVFCYFSSVWQWPFLLVAFMGFLGVVSFRHQDLSHIVAWGEDVATTDDKKEELTLMQTLQKVRQLFFKMQRKSGEVCSLFEKFGNLYNWTDEGLTWSWFTLLFFVASCASLFIVTIQWASTIVDFRHLAFFIGWGVLYMPHHLPEPSMFEIVFHIFTSLLWRAPDDNELAHRMIASSSIRKHIVFPEMKSNESHTPQVVGAPTRAQIESDESRSTSSTSSGAYCTVPPKIFHE